MLHVSNNPIMALNLAKIVFVCIRSGIIGRCISICYGVWEVFVGLCSFFFTKNWLWTTYCVVCPLSKILNWCMIFYEKFEAHLPRRIVMLFIYTISTHTLMGVWLFIQCCFCEKYFFHPIFCHHSYSNPFHFPWWLCPWSWTGISWVFCNPLITCWISPLRLICQLIEINRIEWFGISFAKFWCNVFCLENANQISCSLTFQGRFLLTVYQLL